jgi:hypothetical protein
MIDITKFFYNQLNKHGDVGGHTDIREYVDAMTNSELLDMLLVVTGMKNKTLIEFS